MNNIKERLLGAITVMSEDEAKLLWQLIEKRHLPSNWEGIEEVSPDEIDLQMLRDAESDPDCHDFVSANEARRILNDGAPA